MSYPTNLTISDVFDMWEAGDNPFPDADRVYYWHGNSEVEELIWIPNDTFTIVYADGTRAENVHRFDVIIVQLVNWSYDNDG